MSTSAQILANRQNSLLSTGPKSDAGKAISSLNAVSHGFNATDPVLPNENREEFNELLNQHKALFEPYNAHEDFLVFQLVAAQWKLSRLDRIETEMFAALEDPAQAFTDDQTAKKFARLERYRASMQRTFNRCASELRALRKEQKEANATQIAEKKFEKMMKKLVDSPPPGHEYRPTLVPVDETGSRLPDSRLPDSL